MIINENHDHNYEISICKKIISSNTKNFVISPLSAALVLMMAACGAGGENAEEMKSVLHFDPDNSVHRTGIYSMIEMFNAIQASEVKLANKMYIAKDIEIDPDYINLIKTTFNSSIENIEFKNSAETAQAINQWCAEQTHQRIEEIIDPGNNHPYEYLMNMIVILPNEIDGLDIIENNLEKMEPSAVKGTPYQVRLFLPKFKIENQFDLKIPLNQMGIWLLHFKTMLTFLE
ncbi:Similar to Alaserpin (Manduca sexta) [Cotesia congregata]|uniref:Similar to Alaserpin (Manduca sexta) n=1 Tax=Cotesia congregata TaxID=51543 RepID=A0A8J2HGZ6_COTCN|nr:Similar to Alaserpin (Manduca sexta) [Cotesia congregata]